MINNQLIKLAIAIYHPRFVSNVGDLAYKGLKGIRNVTQSQINSLKQQRINQLLNQLEYELPYLKNKSKLFYDILGMLGLASLGGVALGSYKFLEKHIPQKVEKVIERTPKVKLWPKVIAAGIGGLGAGYLLNQIRHNKINKEEWDWE